MLLNVHSYYSLRYGTLSLKQLRDALLHFGYNRAVLTDINNSTAAIEFVQLCAEKNIEALVGMEFREGEDCLYICIAQNNEGFKEINDWRSYLNKHSLQAPAEAPSFQNVYVIYPYGKKAIADLKEYEFLGIKSHEINKILWENASFKSKCVILQTITYAPNQQRLHQQLKAIDNNILFSQVSKAKENSYFTPKSELLARYQALPELISNTKKLLDSCYFHFDFNSSKNKKSFTGNAYDDKQLLYKYALEGLEKRYGLKNTKAKERLLYELELIQKLHFSSYFLITDDICRYARHRNFHYVGRGSGANSIVAYCLEITNVCPIELDLYFERFLNPQRRNPPDFDIDFSWQDRDAVYDYIFTRYQREHTALMGTMTTFKNRSILRELGKIYGLPKEEIDHLIAYPGDKLHQNKIAHQILCSYAALEKFPNQRSIHASGVLISEKPLTYYSALDYPPKNLPTVQYDMYVAEDMGFEKFDILSQRGIGHIKDSKTLIQKNKGINIDTTQVQNLLKDPKLAKELKSGNTIGCFYIESPAMRQLLRKLECDNYLTLVAASSIIRPGVASSGMMQAFIERHRNPEKTEYLHPVFEEHLQETYGIMVYQEDVMKVGHYFAGLDLAEADVLRRMMSGKYRSVDHLKEIEDKYWKNCKEKGHSETLTKEVWRQMESFAGYSFNKAHSASFAVESYQSLYLKTYYPLEFITAVLNNYGGYYSREVYINEAKKLGATIVLPCINTSVFQAKLIDKTIYLGWDNLLHLEEKFAHLIVEERENNGPYTSLENFQLRCAAGLEQTILLIRSGAFRFLKIDKKTLLWEAHILHKKQKKVLPSAHLFQEEREKYHLPQFEHSYLEDLYDEIELLGFPISGSIFDLAKSSFRGEAHALNLKQYEGKIVKLVAFLATWKTVKTKHKQLMKFCTFIDQYGNDLESVHFPQSLKNYPLKGKGLYLIEGKCIVDCNFPVIEVYRCALMPLHADPRV